jgi:hypothetical protein
VKIDFPILVADADVLYAEKLIKLDPHIEVQNTFEIQTADVHNRTSLDSMVLDFMFC